MEFKQASISDIEKIRFIAQKAWHHSFHEFLTDEQVEYMLDWMYNREILKKHITGNENTYCLAYENDRCLGFMAYENKYKGMPKTKLHKLYILPEAQGRGVGNFLFQKLLEIVKQKGDSSIILNVNKRNKALNFYKRLGFVIVDKEVAPIGNGFVMDDFIMEKVL